MKRFLFVSNFYKFYLISMFWVLLVIVKCAKSDDAFEKLNVTGSFIFNQNETLRNSRQLISLLKNILRPQQSQEKVQTISSPSTSYQNNPEYYQQQKHYQQNPYENQYYPAAVEQKIHSANINPNYQHQYPMLNYPTQQHATVPFYNDNLQQQQPSELQQSTSLFDTNPGAFGGGSSNSASNPLLALLASALGASGGGNNIKVGSMLSKLGIGVPEDLDLSGLISLINFGNFEGMITRVNRFDKLQCIPRMICQMVAKRSEDARIRESTSTTTTTEKITTTEKTKKSKTSNKKKGREDGGRFIKFNGVDTALDQFVKFMDMMQLKDWSLYPYIKGVSVGHEVRGVSECAGRFNSCPFSEDQLVYYFNNYNGGFFQSFRSGRNMTQEAIEEANDDNKNAKV